MTSSVNLIRALVHRRVAFAVVPGRADVERALLQLHRLHHGKQPIRVFFGAEDLGQVGVEGGHFQRAGPLVEGEEVEFLDFPQLGGEGGRA